MEVALPVVIETEQEYERMLAAIEELVEKDEEDLTTEEGRLLQLLATLVEQYEDRHYPLPKSSPHKMLKHLIEDKGLKPSDL